jgi:hypothetical protein
MTESTRGERLKLITEDPPGQQLDQCRPPQIDHQLEPDIGALARIPGSAANSVKAYWAWRCLALS